MTSPTTVQAVRNNAAWCHAVCAARGGRTASSEQLWTSHAPPPYYPNAITLAPSSPALVAALDDLFGSPRDATARPRSVKDSFADLDLTAFGFRILFEARWFGRDSAPISAPNEDAGVAWSPVVREDQFAAWTTAWDPEILRTDPVFALPLFENPEVCFLAATHGTAIVAGAALNRHDGVLGISNFFTREDDTRGAWRSCVHAAMARFPGLPLVGYALGAELETVVASGFGDLGPLRVWIEP